jgi:hypothetical protein
MRAHHTITIAVVVLASALLSKSRPNAAETKAAGADADDGRYDVRVQASQAGGGATWRYIISKTSVDVKSLSSFIVNLGTCGTESPGIGNVVSATVNGADWMDRLVATGVTMSCGVTAKQFVRFDRLPSADTNVIEITLDNAYAVMDSTAWLTTGPACELKAVPGPGCRGYLRTSAMAADPSLIGKTHTDINSYMRRFGFDYTENPNCTGGYGAHNEAIHGAVDVDPYFNRHVFRFDIHIDPVIDGDRCSASTVDRQRNEMKSITNNMEWASVQGNWDEWQILEWKFRLPKGLQPTANFFHIHQLKAQDGPNNGNPTITITARAASSGLNQRIQIIHAVDGVSTGKGTLVDNVPLSDFEDEWVQVREEVHYRHDGSYAVNITRIRDGRVLIDFKDDHIDMWRIGSSYIRSKFGLYRSLAGGQLTATPVGQSPLLKNESLWVTDFRVYEKNPNPTPSEPHH